VPDIARHVALSQKLDYENLDWKLAAEVGLSEREKRILPYFADVEGQTVFYMLEVLKLKPARDPDTLAFITIWNYEEYFHGAAMMKLLAECGSPLERDRVTRVRVGARLRARVEDMVQVAMSRLFPRSFVALWMAWGAAQELLTSHGYEELGKATSNPVLRELCVRIAKQERRHFAFYFASARERLAESPFARRFVRFIFDRFWNPVGAGVKSDAEVAHTMAELFPPDVLPDIAARYDARMSELPGLEGLDVMARYSQRIHKLLPPEARHLAPASEPSPEGA
jgi:hypothetical protein